MRHCCRPFSREATLVLVSSAFLYAVHWCVYTGINLSLPHNSGLALDCAHFALWIVLLPIAGWIAESWMGRYKAIVAGLVVCAVSVIMVQFVFIMLKLNENNDTSWIAFALLIIVLIICTFGSGSFCTIMLPFTLDQMIGASAEELSAAVQWHYWGFFIGQMVEDVLQCVSSLKQHQDMLFLILGSLSLLVVLIMDCLCHKWLVTHNKTGNPVKLIFQVLNYSRKNKCPRLRSALTYIDEEHPSRLDFGKHKFGGPFTEEEVEDVKTVFRLMPLLIAAFGAFLSLEYYDQLSLHAIVTTEQTFQDHCISNLKHTTYYVTSFFCIPVYRFVVYPLLSKYIPSMLKLIGAGLFICIVSAVSDLTVLTIGPFNSSASQCISYNLTETATVPIYWVPILNIFNGIGVVCIMCSLLEFVIAQTPNRMRGIMMGLLITAIGIGYLSTYILTAIFRKFPAITHGCVFYYYLVLSLLLLLILTVFGIFAKRYKLRERERHVNIQAIAEEYNEKYLDQEEEYMREVGLYD